MKASELNAKREHQKTAYGRLYDTLLKKSEFIRVQYQKELTEPIMKRLKHEEEHIKICMEYIEQSESLILELQKSLQVKQMALNHFYSERKEYQDKYYDLVDKMVEESVKPELNILYGS